MWVTERIHGCPVGLGYVFHCGGPKLLEGQRPILAPAEEKPPMVVVTVQGAPPPSLVLPRLLVCIGPVSSVLLQACCPIGSSLFLKWDICGLPSSSADSHLISLCANQALFGSRCQSLALAGLVRDLIAGYDKHDLYLDGLSYVFLSPFELDVSQVLDFHPRHLHQVRWFIPQLRRPRARRRAHEHSVHFHLLLDIGHC